MQSLDKLVDPVSSRSAHGYGHHQPSWPSVDISFSPGPCCMHLASRRSPLFGRNQVAVFDDKHMLAITEALKLHDWVQGS